MKLIIQIPCYNEEETLPQTLQDLPRPCQAWIRSSNWSLRMAVLVARRKWMRLPSWPLWDAEESFVTEMASTCRGPLASAQEPKQTDTIRGRT